MRGLVGEGTVSAFAVVEGLEVVEDGGGGSGLGGEWGTVIEQLTFEGGEGTFCKGVVVAVAGGTHALAQAVSGEELTGGEGGVLAAAIGVEEGVGRDDACVERTVQGAGDDLGVEGVGELPAEDGATEEIEDDGEIEPAFVGGDIGTERSEIACRRQPAGQRRRALANIADEVSPRRRGWSGLGEEIGRRMGGVIGARLARPPASLVPSASSVVFGRKGFLGRARRPVERMRRATRFSVQETPRL